MNRRKFDLSAYGKPGPRPAQISESSVKAALPIVSDSKNLERVELQTSCDDVVNTLNESAKVDLATKFDPAHEVSAGLPRFATVANSRVGLPISRSSESEVVGALTADKPNSATLPDSHRSSTHVQNSSFTSEATQVPNRKAHPPPSTASVQGPSPTSVGNSTPEIHNPVTNAPTKTCETQSPSSLQAHVTPRAKDRTAPLNPHVDAMSNQRQPAPAVTRNERLRQLQSDSLNRISRKAAVEKIKPANASVSIRDLDLARKPVDPENPRGSFRKWAQDSPLYAGGYGEGTAAFSSIEKQLSVLPQAPSTRASPAQLEPVTHPDRDDARHSKWAIKDEMKAEKAEAGSNVWGSQIPSNATRGSNVSYESFGKLLRRQEPAKEELLCDWQGNMMPPPADWAERPRYNNNNPDFKVQFKSYVGDLQGRYNDGIQFKKVEHSEVDDVENVPDGIGMVPRTHTIDISNATDYGYQLNNNPELYEAMIKYAQPTYDDDFDLKTKLDPSDDGNRHHDNNETTDILVTNWNKHLANARGEALRIEIYRQPYVPANDKNHSDSKSTSPIEEKLDTETSDDDDDDEAAPLAVPKLNIYLRPGTDADFYELTRIYNWYVAHSTQPPELREVGENSMQSRMQFCKESKLPFIVAALKSQKNARRIPPTDNEDFSRRLQLPVTHKQSVTLTRTEKLAGFCCANDFSQPDFVEYLTADIEIYVDAQYRRMGVGKALMDKMLHMCDRNHTLTMDVPFHCDQEIRHLYEAGGNRDLRKVLVTLRIWNKPRPFAINVHGKRNPRKIPLAKTEENDYDRWLKKWFESIGFEQEGHLKASSAKHGRYIDTVYLSRFTCYEPPEGKVPDPPEELLNAYDYAEDEEGGW